MSSNTFLPLLYQKRPRGLTLLGWTASSYRLPSESLPHATEAALHFTGLPPKFISDPIRVFPAHICIETQARISALGLVPHCGMAALCFVCGNCIELGVILPSEGTVSYILQRWFELSKGLRHRHADFFIVVEVTWCQQFLCQYKLLLKQHCHEAILKM